MIWTASRRLKKERGLLLENRLLRAYCPHKVRAHCPGWNYFGQQCSEAYDSLKERLNAENADNPELYSQLVEQRNSVDTSLKRIAESEKEHSKIEQLRSDTVAKIAEGRLALSTRRTQMTMPATRREVLEALERLWDCYPDQRLGQVVTNVAILAGREPDDVYDLEADEIVEVYEDREFQGSETFNGKPSVVKDNAYSLTE